MEPQNNQPQQESPPIQQEKKSNTLWIVLAFVLLVVILVGGGIFLWQNNQKQIADLNSQLEQLRNENTELEVKVEELEKTDPVGVCVDSDVNDKPDDIYIKGSVTYTDENGVEREVDDECTGSKTQVNEMWCYESPAGSGSYVSGKMVYDCPKGCLDGACNK